MPQRDLEYWALAAPGRPGGRTVAGTRPCCAPGLLQARAGRPADSLLELRRRWRGGAQTCEAKRPRSPTVVPGSSPVPRAVRCSGSAPQCPRWAAVAGELGVFKLRANPVIAVDRGHGCGGRPTHFTDKEPRDKDEGAYRRSPRLALVSVL